MGSTGRRRAQREIRQAITQKALFGAVLALLITIVVRELPSIKRELKMLMM